MRVSDADELFCGSVRHALLHETVLGCASQLLFLGSCSASGIFRGGVGVGRAFLHEAVLGRASQLLLGSTCCTIVSGINVGHGKCDEHQSDQFLHWMSPWLVEIPRYYRSIMRHRQA